MHILSILCALTWALASANEFIPKVTKSILKTTAQDLRESDDYDYPNVARFGDSDTLILTFGNRLHISFDDGEQWENINGIEGNIIEISFDQFRQERAFILTGSKKTHEMYVTENGGKNWSKFRFPEDDGLNYCYPITHPFDRKLILLNCDIIHDVDSIISGRAFDEISDDGSIVEEATWEESHFEKAIYGSDDAGNNFMRITASGSSDDHTTCSFAALEDSAVKDDGIYCIETIEKSEDAELQTSNQRKIDSGQASVHKQRKSRGTLFYTKDFGKTKKTFDELSGFSVESIFVLPSCVAIITSDASDSGNRRSKLWISKNTSFKVASLPKGMFPHYVQRENDQGQLILSAGVKKDDSDSWISLRMLVSDSSGLKFSFVEPVHHSNGNHISQLGPVGNLKGTLWGLQGFKNDNAEEQGSWLEKFVGLLKNLFSKDSDADIWEPIDVTKVSFDNGKTWTNLKIVDPSGKNRHLFKCDIDDVEHCSLQVFPSDKEEPTAGIIIRRGIVGKNSSELWDDYRMIFISRDGGESWELAFEFPVYTAILDFGNIIVAMPNEDNKVEEEADIKLYTKFYFSLDQGRTWGLYRFDDPIRSWADVSLECRSLKTQIRFIRELETSKEYVSYSIDFSNAFGGTACTTNDLEKWYLSKGNCIDGKRYSFDRRKADANCLVRKTFGELELHEEKCD